MLLVVSLFALIYCVFLQHALRLIAFRKLHLVLGVDPLPNPAERKEVKEAVAKKGEEEKEKEEIEGSAAKRPRLD